MLNQRVQSSSLRALTDMAMQASEQVQTCFERIEFLRAEVRHVANHPHVPLLDDMAVQPREQAERGACSGNLMRLPLWIRRLLVAKWR